MPSIAVEELEPGMILKGPVCNLDRQLLLGAGAVIAERHIRLFQSWGITAVEVRAAEAPVVDGPAAEDPGAVAAADRDVCQILVHQMMDFPVVQELRRVLVARKLRGGKLRKAA